MKLFFCFSCFICLQAAAQCPPPQLVNTNYDFWGLTMKNLAGLPKIPTPVSCRDTGNIYFNPADSNLYGWTGVDFRCLSCGLGSLTTPGLPVQSVQFNSGPGVFRGSSHLIWDTAHFQLNGDSSLFLRSSVGTNVTAYQYPFNVFTTFGGYGGMLVQNNSNSNSAATRITLRSVGGNHELQLNQFAEPFATDAAVIAATGLGGFVIRADSSSLITELGPPGGLIGESWRIWYPNNEMFVGNQLAHSYYQYPHGVQLFVAEKNTGGHFLGSILAEGRILIGDEGAGFSVLQSANFHGDTTYVEGVGFNFIGLTKLGGSASVGKLDSVGRFYVPQSIAAGSTTKSDTSAILEATSISRGFLCPRMSTVQKLAIFTPAEGLQVYDLTLHQMSYFNGTTWVNF